MEQISFSPPDITEEEINEVAAALRSGWITTGPARKSLKKSLRLTVVRQDAYALILLLHLWRWRLGFSE